MKGFSILAASLALLSPVAAAPPQPPVPAVVEKRADPRVTISTGTVVGKTRLATEAFNGIPYALPPVGNRRLKPPVRLTSSFGTYDAGGIPNACPQFFADNSSNDFLAKVLGAITDLPFFKSALKISEDCLTVNVIRPAGTKAGDKLPVLFWIFGGGFELGWTSMYDGGPLVAAAASMGKPYVFVAVNYRVGGFGFLPGKEVLRDGAANLGLLDQRMGLEWVADNIAAFGGDPDKVTIWGESAGAISVFDQMALYDGNNKYNGKPLFRGAIMNSGSVVPADPVDCPKGQVIYDTVVKAAGCSSAADSLQCLRELPFERYLRAANSVPAILSYNSVALSYLPRPDGKVLTDSPDRLVPTKKYAAVPMIIGDQEDEGTLFSLFQPNITNTPRLVSYLSTIFFHGATNKQMNDLVNTYDDNLLAGSPFRTGLFNEIYPGFKRLAAILGDLVFTLSRRVFLAECLKANPDVPSWSYLSSYNFGTPVLGTFHGSDILQVFYGILPNFASRSTHSFYANFIYNLDPNNSRGGTNSVGTKVNINWPQWGRNRDLMNFFANSASLLKDDFRQRSYNWIASNLDALHI
ncbi:Alpha/Beta hydrolase protein [Podospora aff. communis PSN243]|uniref:Carboxylic ester hydrolase n=1 Tax=Podospora aff. communis PSN243 TaxID=3040156 RepID=A0AAV9GHM4_9PEZI|nr:Alpha/Beta hydrolase protein [Podospora aff. communis PSN243]